jgi:hypothetical protein
MDPDNCALNTDGSLKNAEEIEWDHSPTQPSKTLPPIGISTSKPTAPIFQFGNQLGPEHFATTKRTQEEAKASDHERTHGGSKGKGSTTTTVQLKPKPVKSTAVGHLKASSILCTNQSSSHSVTTVSSAANSDDEEADVQAKKKRKRGDRSADVLTVFKYVDPDNIGEGYECEICM